MNRFLPLNLFFLILFTLGSLRAQDYPCLDFENVPINTQLGPAAGIDPGEAIFSQEGVEVRLLEILYPDGSTGFGNAMIMGEQVQWLDGQFAFLGNNSFEFDFSSSNAPLTEVCFDYFDGGGVENFAINGSEVKIVERFSEIADMEWPGVEVRLIPGQADSDFLERGTVCIRGDIRRLLVGGQEFGIDNVCYRYDPDPCPIENLRAEIVSCDEEGDFNIKLDFDYLSPLTVITSFDIFIDGEHVAFISEEDLPYLLENIQPLTDALDFALTVCVNDNPDCCESIILQKECPEEEACMVFEGLEESLYGSSADTPPGMEIYSENDIGLRLIPFQSLFWFDTYGDLLVLNQEAAPEMTAASGQYLKMESINIVFDLTALANPVEKVTVDFYYNGGAINLAANGASLLIQNALTAGFYALAPGISVEVAFSNNSATEGQLIFEGNIQSLLIGGEGDLRTDNLCVNTRPEVCSIDDIIVDIVDFTATGQAVALLDLAVTNPGSDFFKVFVDGQLLGEYRYENLPVEVLLPCSTHEGSQIAVCDGAEGSDCCLRRPLPLLEPCSGECSIYNLQLRATPCNPNNVFRVKLDFDHENTSETFTLWLNGNDTGQEYAYSSLPLDLGPYVGPTMQELVFEVHDSQDFSCSASAALPPVNCEPDCYPIDEVAYFLTDCNEAGEFYVVITELFPAHPNLAYPFWVAVNGQDFGEFSSAELPAEIGPLPASEGYELWVSTMDIPECAYRFEVGPVDCGGEPCRIEPILEAECLSNTSYALFVDIESQGVGEQFTLSSAISGFQRTLDYELLPLTLEMPYTGQQQDVIRICDREQPNCCASVELPIHCPCPAGELRLVPNECREDGTFTAKLGFEFPGNPPSDVFTVTAGDYTATFNFSDIPVTIGPFVGNGQTIDVVVAIPGTSCELAGWIQAPHCGNGDCIFSQVIAEPLPCENGQFFIDVEARVNNPGVLGYYIFADGRIFGPYEYGNEQPFVTIGPFEGDGSSVIDILTLDIENPACFGYLEIGPVDCQGGEECQLLGLAAEPLECRDNGYYDLLIDFETINPGNEFFDLYGPDGGLIGFYPLSSMPLRIENFGRGNGQEVRVTACINDQPDCCERTAFLAPDCNGGGEECSIYGVEASFAYCDDAGNFYVQLHFQFDNVGSQGYEVRGNGQDYGTFSYEVPFPIIGPFPAGGGAPFELIVIDREFPECRDFTVFGTFDCNPGPELCLTFDEFETAVQDTIHLALGNPRDAIYDEGGIVLNAVPVPLANGSEYFDWAIGFAAPPCGTFLDGGNLGLNGGVEMKLSELDALPAVVTFDISYCSSPNALPLLALGANGEIYTGPLSDLPAELPGGIRLEFTPYTNFGLHGRVRLEGPMESLVIGGRGAFIDNLCIGQLEPPTAVQEVWPGDANADNIAHHIDLLNIGLAYGQQGPGRVEDAASTFWSAFSADDWGLSFADGTDLKHADCNGDGVINRADREVIAQNYGLTHGPAVPVSSPPNTDTDPPVFVDFPAELPSGGTFEVPVVLGSEDMPLEDVYGIAFTLSFDPEILQAASLRLEYPVSWFGEPGVNTLSIDRTYAEEGKLEVAITRIDRNNVSGYGPVAHLIGIIDDIAGLSVSGVAVERIRAITKEEVPVPLRGRSVEFEINGQGEEPIKETDGIFSVFPNPASGWVAITSKHGFEPEELTLMSLDGSVLNVPQEGNRRISLERVPSGTYILQIRSGKARVHKLIVKP